jgi:hypothetical protein
MSHVWVRTVDGDLLRADQIRQITVVEGLHAVAVGGNQFLIAEIENRAASAAAARELTAAIAEGAGWSHAIEVAVVAKGADWLVELRSMPDGESVEAVTA